MKTKTGLSYSVKIYICGSYDIIKHICRDFCHEEEVCVNVSKHDYIYKGGEQSGVVVELIKYPKFTSRDEQVWFSAKRLADRIREQAYQNSYTIMDDEKAEWCDYSLEDE